MKPRNFLGRKARRRARAQARQEGKPMPYDQTYEQPAIADIRFRVGGRNRGPDGVPTSAPAPRSTKGGAS